MITTQNVWGSCAQRAIEALHGGSTFVAITHRLATSRDVDVIYVLERGAT